MTRSVIVRNLFIGVLAGLAMTLGGVTANDKEPIYGYESMTPQERAEYRADLRKLKTEEDREQFRAEHKKKIDSRSKDKEPKR